MRMIVRWKAGVMADEQPKPNVMATGTATVLTGGAVKVLTPFAIALGAWLSKHTGVVFPDGYGTDLMSWALVAIPAAVAYWHARGQ